MHEAGTKKLFHANWLQHGSQTFLQEAHHPSVLFSMLLCSDGDDIELGTIVKKCNLKDLDQDDQSHLPDFDPDHPNNFFCR